jgi:hypothetical protein
MFDRWRDELHRLLMIVKASWRHLTLIPISEGLHQSALSSPALLAEVISTVVILLWLDRFGSQIPISPKGILKSYLDSGAAILEI